jgi:hypothetical protein
MIYKLSDTFDLKRFQTRCVNLIEKGARVELIEKKPVSGQQRKYLHLIFSWFALEYGETKEYVKQIIFKRWVNKDLFKTERANKKTGEIREDWKSTEYINFSDMTTAIDRFRNWSGKQGIYLPRPNESNYLEDIEYQIQKNKQWL